MNQPRLLTVVASLMAFAPNGLAAEIVYPPASNTTVSVSECGANPTVVVGSSPFNGRVIPDQDPSLYTCTIGFATTGLRSPFTIVVPTCTTQIQGQRTKWTVALTADYIKFIWDKVIVGVRVPPQWISWNCQ